ncbi:MAG: stage II sporulation protein R [Bacillota bacterium]
MNRRTKRAFLAVVCCAVCAAVCAVCAEGSGADDTLLRFHVIANSDSPADQAVKLRVRDAVLAEIAPALAAAESVDEAEAAVGAALPDIEAAADAVLAAEGKHYASRAEVTESFFPTKSYGGLTLPAGRYRACRITLGAGRGKNWWCVLYPPLCFVDLSDDVAVAVTERPETAADGGTLSVNGSLYRVRIKSKLWEWLP